VIKVISLPTATARREEFVGRNSHVNYEFVDAVNGHNLTSEQQQLFDQVQYRPGAKGCALSHLFLWNQAIESNQTITIAEDDSVFRYDFEQQSQSIMAQLPPTWEVVFWGWNFNGVMCTYALGNISPTAMLFDQNSLTNNLDLFQKFNGSCIIWPLMRCFGTVAYTVNPVGAKRFKDQCFPMKNTRAWYPVNEDWVQNVGIDIAMNLCFSPTQSFVCFPPLVATPNTESFIGDAFGPR
jgi:glycosyl transferase, family 25